MYYIYIIRLPKEEVYIGCTNNIRRRKNQHNENILKQKNRFAKYVAINYPNLKLKENDFNIIATFEDRKEALQYERKITKSYIGKNVVLNDNYNIDCSRLGKNIGNTSKKYVLIDFIKHTETYLTNLRQFCLKNNLEYRLIQKTIKGNCVSYNRYKIFYKDEWENLQNKDYYLSGKFKEDLENENIEMKKQIFSKKYLLETPNNTIIEVKNLDEFARKHNISSGTLHATYINNHKAKGYKVIKRM